MGVIKTGAAGIKGMITGKEAAGKAANYIVSHVFKNLQPGGKGYRTMTLLTDYLLQIPEEGAEEGFQSITTNIAELIAINIHNARMEGDIAGLPEDEQEAIRALRQVQKKSVKEIAAEVAGEAGAGMVAAFGTGGIAVTFKSGVSIQEARRLRRSARESGSFAEFERDAARSPNFEGVRPEAVADSINKLWEDGEQFREQAEAARVEELRARRLYRSIDQSGETYRGEDGNLYAELTRHTESGGLETGEYVVGNPRKGEHNAHAVIRYEKHGDKTEITSVNVGEKYERLRGEIFQNFANELGETVTLGGESYQPGEGTARARRYGFTAERQGSKAAAASPKAFRFDREYYSAPDSEADAAAKRNFAAQLRSLGTRVEGDAAINTVVDFYDTVGRKWFGRGFDAFTQKLAGGKTEGFFQKLEHTDAEAARWIAKNRGQAADPAAVRRIQENLTDAQRKEARENIYGYTVPGADGAVKAIKAARNADVSTFIHEGVHAFTHLAKALDPELYGQMMEAAGFSQEAYDNAPDAIQERMTRDAMEKLAYGAEAYLKEGPQPARNSALQNLYERIKEFLKDLMFAAEKAERLTPEVRALFDGLFGEQGNAEGADGAPAEAAKTARDGGDGAETGKDTDGTAEGRQEAASEQQGSEARLNEVFDDMEANIKKLKASFDRMIEPELYSDSFDRIIKDESRPIEERSEAVVRKAGREYFRHAIEETNSRFNEELGRFLDGSLEQGHIFKLGGPGEILRRAGFPAGQEIELAADHLRRKANSRKHIFNPADLKDLVRAINEPVAVFAYGDRANAQNVIIEIQQNGKNYLVGIHFDQERRGTIVSEVRGLYPKDTKK